MGMGKREAERINKNLDSVYAEFASSGVELIPYALRFISHEFVEGAPKFCPRYPIFSGHKKSKILDVHTFLAEGANHHYPLDFHEPRFVL